MPERRIHLIGVGGVGMAGLAVLLKARGHVVTGCDLAATPRTRWLEGCGVPVAIGHDPTHLAGVDEVIVTPAVSRDAPELAAARGIGLTVRARGEVLAELVNAGESIAVCGSHGKTTTASWITRLLLALGENVAWCIGGESGDFPVAGRSGQSTTAGPVLVVEADESDGTLALYRARTLVVTNCEYDHPDHFKTAADYRACFDTARRNAGEVVEGESLGPLEPFESQEVLKTLAPHNRRNARTAIEVALRRGHALDAILAALPAIVAVLPDRRFQIIYPLPDSGPRRQSTAVGGVSAPLVVTDYAHHPTEMRCAVDMARARCTGRLRVLFQPHRYSRTKALLADFPAAFAGADEVVLCPTYAAFETPIDGGDIADLYRTCRESSAFAPGGCRLFLARSCAEAWEHAANSMGPGDLTLLLGAGDIIALAPRVAADLALPGTRSRRRIWIGQGSNTWKSDLNLSVEYVRTKGPADAPGATLGIQWMAGIPGTIGGWVRMNAGAFGHSISEVLSRVKVDGRWLAASECGFGYRHSSIDGEIQDVEIRPGPYVSPEEPQTAAEYLARRPHFPSGTFGSFFKNPSGSRTAGQLLDAAGAKELCVGGAFVWREHANVIVRGEGATASDVLALARLMRNRVLFRFGIALEPEVRGISG